MTIPDANMINIASIPTSNNAVAPPVNNACVPDIFNKLDAEAIEKTRVLNSLLDMKLEVQQKVLTKYKNAAERRINREREQLALELRNIARRLPNYADIPRLESKVKKLKKRRRSNKGPLHNCVYTTEPKELNGISAEKDDKPFCDRFVAHHLPIKNAAYRRNMQIIKGQSMPDLRPKPDDNLRVLRPPPALIDKEDLLKSNVLPPILSIDDTFVTSKCHYRTADDDDDDDDDSKTV